MTSENLKEMIEYTKNWMTWLEKIAVKPEEKENKKNFIKQMDDVIQKWKKELVNNSIEQD